MLSEQCETITVNNIITALGKIQTSNPVIHNITNFVVMQLTANILLALGASPIMAHTLEEQQEIAKISQALVINIGTLDPTWIYSMNAAMNIANQYHKPIVFDPVGAGATNLRTQISQDFLLNHKISVLRGNAAEIMALNNEVIKTKGVDSSHASQDAIIAGRYLAEKYNTVVVISGKQDIIISAEDTVLIDNGDVMMTHVTGMGCSATALIGAFVAVVDDPFIAATAAMATLAMAAELAAKNSDGPGSFQVALLDALFQLKAADYVNLKLNLLDKLV
ncbi:MAG: hydroxyethylthiazole kinase [Pseudomonadota bacterium]